MLHDRSTWARYVDICAHVDYINGLRH